ncbi:carbamoyltransferase HypF [Flagellimonas allohymeniacidonis]|uniref:Carbamoyltransferase n=1 Tax=Flagellimonas allohymeniacidonis TaxID=2517819 RepID=A0A4Q8QIZ5_9FLAO|nr:carbamoyltransferase HypF [Allomuricauda hymeniacidonis]TAI49258.1 carbamoyltransferase HypF [Allomuricauda hymeniacidonis]
MNTWHIHIEGRVQGVGFRPYVYRLALERDLTGVVYNALDGVHVKFSGSEDQAEEFYAAIIDKTPSLARITNHKITRETGERYKGFQILQDQSDVSASLMLPPDFAVCENCKNEVLLGKNRRSGYPFITCTQCGPRFSLITELPYERAFTTMEAYQMCHSCKQEYGDPRDRRYHSQTNSCTACGVRVALWNNKGQKIETNSQLAIEKIARLWEEGKIIAIKGVGGYLLTCDATNAKAIRTLRQRKHRPSKPFACMYPNINDVQRDCHIDSAEQQMLTGEVAPILLLPIKKKSVDVALSDIAPGLNQIGVMLPYTPLYLLLMQAFGKPVIATSGNLSNTSIVFEDKKIFMELSDIWDFALTNDREIVTPQDDSVVRFSPFKKQPILIRRSRGIAPNYFWPDTPTEQKTILALGASQKSAFGLLYGGLLYLSQYLGDLTFLDSTENLKRTIQYFINMLNCRPEIILVDKHPNYYSTEYGKYLADVYGGKLVSIQHHFAHFAGVLAEHSLIQKSERVLGIIWDGTGYGNDGNSWGGEFLVYENRKIKRLVHIAYVPLILGDKMATEPRLSALSHSGQNPAILPLLKDKFSTQEWKIYQRLLDNGSPLKTSSMGRLFDAVACLLGIMDTQTYEGEAALQLETMAQTYFDYHEGAAYSGYDTQISYLEGISTMPIIEGVVRDLNNGTSKNEIAFKFHYSLVRMVEEIALTNAMEKIAFSGGVFQNGLLVDLMIIHLEDTFQLYFHQQVSPNDEGIALGKLAYYQNIEE